MPEYLLQAAYTPEGWRAVVENPQDRIEIVTKAIERLGGKVHGGWLTFGDYDVVTIIEMPSNVHAAAIAMAFAAGGACRAIKTTPLLTRAEGVEAMKKASATGYKAATAS